MDIRNKLKEDSVKALKMGNKRLVSVLRYLVSLIDKKELGMPVGQMDEKTMVEVLRKELKNKRESKEMFAKGGRDDLVTEVEEEIEILSTYLPAEVGEEEIRKEVVKALAENEANFGIVIKTVMTKFAGSVDGGIVSRLVKEEMEKLNE